MSSTEVRKQYTLDIQDRGRYIFAHVKGNDSNLDIAMSYWSEIAQAALKSGLKRLLVVEDIAEMISIAEVHQLVTSLADLPVKDVRVAFVDLHAEHASLNNFGILVGENRGFSLKASTRRKMQKTGCWKNS